MSTDSSSELRPGRSNRQAVGQDRGHADSAARTQAQRTATSDKAMLAAAVELLLERGTDKTTLQAIGERAGYSRGLATYRFGSKAGLFDEVCKSIARRWISYLQSEVGDKVGIEAMSAAADAYFRFVTDSPREAKALHTLFCDAASSQSEFRRTAVEVYQRQQQDVAAWVSAGIAAGTVRKDADPASEGARYVAYIAGITYLWIINPKAVQFSKVHQDFKQQLRLSLAP